MTQTPTAEQLNTAHEVLDWLANLDSIAYGDKDDQAIQRVKGLLWNHEGEE